MRKILLLLLSASLLASTTLYGQYDGVWQEVRENRLLASGQDNVYPMQKQKLTRRPRGYRERFVSMYSRHGSRYAYTSKTYDFLKENLSRAERDSNLTEYGAALAKELAPFFETVRYRVGDLSPLGWNQLAWIARTMKESFPRAFSRGASVDACVSPSMRSALSMSSFCLALGQACPGVRIYEHQSIEDLPAARPNRGNPFAYADAYAPFPIQESPEQFCERKIDYDAVFGKIFKDPSRVECQDGRIWALDYLYMLVAGMNSLPQEIVPDVSGIFSAEEFVQMWEVDNYLRFREYYKYLSTCCSVYEDIIAKADARLKDGRRGADLRFGHDHVLLTLYMIANVEGYGNFPDKADDVALWFRNYITPMGGNMQLVFYTPRRSSKPVLVKLLVNGKESFFSGLKPVKGPYYDWEELKDFFGKRMDLFRVPLSR